MICPVCREDLPSPFELTLHIERAHPPRERVNRGRRFFLMGALALPVARKLEALAPIVAPREGWIYEGRLGGTLVRGIVPIDMVIYTSGAWALAT